MRIAFVVNTTGLTGGIKIVFQHANNLAEMGHEVSIIHLLRLEKGFSGFFVGCLKKIKYLFFKEKASWFNLHKKIKVLSLFNLKNFNDADIMVATANETADWVNDYAGRVNKFYFIQDYEVWTRKKEFVDRTYSLPLKKIVVSNYLKQMLKEKFNEDSDLILNGVNIEDFSCPVKKINPKKKILLLYHPLPHKGFDFAVKALEKIKNKYPGLVIEAFGAYQPEIPLPLGIKWHFKPDRQELKEIYGSADIFLNASLSEGFGLTPMEAMAAQCAVVTTKSGAICDYASNGESALIVPPGNVDELADALEKLLRDGRLLKRIAENGYKNSKNFSIKDATKKIEEIFKK